MHSNDVEISNEDSVLFETKPPIDFASEKFLSIPESEITESDVLDYVNGYKPTRSGFDAFRLDSALNKAVTLSSKRNFKKEKYIVNTLLLKQTLFNTQDQCFPGYNMNEHPRKNPVMEWFRDVVAKELNMEHKLAQELFLMSELYHFIKDNPNNDLDYDTSYIRHIDLTLDSCDKHFLVD